MKMLCDERRDLYERQRNFLKLLLRSQSVSNKTFAPDTDSSLSPHSSNYPDFEIAGSAKQLAALQEALRQKRWRAVSRYWPCLFAAGNSREIFDFYASNKSIPRTGGALLDGRLYARFLFRLSLRRKNQPDRQNSFSSQADKLAQAIKLGPGIDSSKISEDEQTNRLFPASNMPLDSGCDFDILNGCSSSEYSNAAHRLLSDARALLEIARFDTFFKVSKMLKIERRKRWELIYAKFKLFMLIKLLKLQSKWLLYKP